MYMLAEPDKTQVLRANLVDQLNGWALLENSHHALCEITLRSI